jgi:hypothetical protein
MSLQHQDPDAKADGAGGDTPEGVATVRACPTCQAELADGQDWCLSCGQAQPGRLANLPGKRAAATVLALTTVLVGGAVAASYAALQDGSAAPGPANATQLAQASTTQPAAPAPVPAPAQPTTALPVDPAPPADSPTTPDTSKTPAPAPAPAPTPTPAPPASSGSSSSGSSTSSPPKNSKADTRTSTTPADTTPEPMKLDGSASALYDPYTRNTAVGGDATKTLDGDPGTSYPITVASGSGSIAAGMVVDLGKQRGIREVDLTTKTPGFKMELYATDSDELPPDVLDTRWAHLKDVSNVGAGAGNKQMISLGSGTTKYRHLLLWFTAPPADGLTVRVSELKLLG